MGDVIHALPVVNDLHAHFPTCQVDWMVESPFADLVRIHPGVRQVVTVDLRAWRKQGVRATWRHWKALRDSLASQQYDYILDLQGLIKSALLACAAPGVRIGAARTHAKEGLASLFYRRTATWDNNSHAVERLRQLAGGLLGYQPAGAPVFYPGRLAPTSPETAGPPKDSNTQLASPVVWFLHATARPEKQWPQGNWVELGRLFNSEGYRVVLPWGNAAEQAAAQHIAAPLASAQVLPRMPLADLGPQLGEADFVVGVDTGLTHLAAAYYRPMVALFFATPAWRFAPTFNPLASSVGDVGSTPDVQQVWAAAQQQLGLTASGA